MRSRKIFGKSDPRIFVCGRSGSAGFRFIDRHKAASHAQSANMRPLATAVAWSVCVDTTVSLTQIDEPILMPFQL